MNCRVVNCVCVCVCVYVVFWPRYMGPKSITNGTYIAQGGGKGQPKTNINILKNIKNANVKNNNKNKFCFWNMGRFSQKMEGSTAGRLPKSYSKNDRKVILNIAQRKVEQI